MGLDSSVSEVNIHLFSPPLKVCGRRSNPSIVAARTVDPTLTPTSSACFCPPFHLPRPIHRRSSLLHFLGRCSTTENNTTGRAPPSGSSAAGRPLAVLSRVGRPRTRRLRTPGPAEGGTLPRPTGMLFVWYEKCRHAKRRVTRAPRSGRVPATGVPATADGDRRAATARPRGRATRHTAGSSSSPRVGRDAHPSVFQSLFVQADNLHVIRHRPTIPTRRDHLQRCASVTLTRAAPRRRCRGRGGARRRGVAAAGRQPPTWSLRLPRRRPAQNERRRRAARSRPAVRRTVAPRRLPRRVLVHRGPPPMPPMTARLRPRRAGARAETCIEGPDNVSGHRLAAAACGMRRGGTCGIRTTMEGLFGRCDQARTVALREVADVLGHRPGIARRAARPARTQDQLK